MLLTTFSPVATPIAKSSTIHDFPILGRPARIVSPSGINSGTTRVEADGKFLAVVLNDARDGTAFDPNLAVVISVLPKVGPIQAVGPPQELGGVVVGDGEVT